MTEDGPTYDESMNYNAALVAKGREMTTPKELADRLESYPGSVLADYKERASMAREICLYRGENPHAIQRNGHEFWEKYLPLAGAVIREAERLFLLRAALAESPPSEPETKS
jgi:hypothetical protein